MGAKAPQPAPKGPKPEPSPPPPPARGRAALEVTDLVECHIRALESGKIDIQEIRRMERLGVPKEGTNGSGMLISHAPLKSREVGRYFDWPSLETEMVRGITSIEVRRVRDFWEIRWRYAPVEEARQDNTNAG